MIEFVSNNSVIYTLHFGTYYFDLNKLIIYSSSDYESSLILAFSSESSLLYLLKWNNYPQDLIDFVQNKVLKLKVFI